MQLTETQIEQANVLIKKYKFCTLETQKKLQEACFFEKVECNMCITVHRYNKEIPCDVEAIESALPYGETIGFLPFPQFEEVWEVLPDTVNPKKSMLTNAKKGLNTHSIHYRANDGFLYPYIFLLEINITEAACLLWLELKEKNFL